MDRPLPHIGPIMIGSDRVSRVGENVVIEARELIDWPLREFCKLPIFFEEQKYFLLRVGDARRPFVRRYELEPWPDNLAEQSSQTFNYDSEFVAERDALARKQRGYDKLEFILKPLYPFLGLLWSETKNDFLARVGFAPRSITSASIALTFNLAFVEAVFVGWLGSGLLGWTLGTGRIFDWALLFLLLLDTVLRYSQLLKSEPDQHWGFCEWLWPRKA